MQLMLDRRRFVALGLYGGAALLVSPVLSGCGKSEQGDDGADPSSEGRFFDTHQYETIRALTGVLIPEDEDAGAISANVVDYIDFLLGAFRVNPPRIFAAGPFSGRHGGENGFSVYLFLSRVKEISWRIHIEGSKSTIPEWETLTGRPHTRGLQEIYTEGVASLDELCQTTLQADFKDLAPGERVGVVRKGMDTEFLEIVREHAVEGMYAAPEYGGNSLCMGWEYIRYEGDRQPVGYTREQVEERDRVLVPDALTAQDADDVAGILREMIEQRQERHSRGFAGGRA